MPAMTTRQWGLLLAAASAAALGVAHGSEKWAELVPCALCLVERWPYRIAAILGLIVAAWPNRAVMGLLTLTFLGAAIAGGVHAGVELGWWPSPLPECAAPVITGATLAERLAHMPAIPSKPCDEPTYLIPGVPLSMAAMNLIYALALSAAAACLTTRKGSP